LQQLQEAPYTHCEPTSQQLAVNPKGKVMPRSFRTILSPVEFDEHSLRALELAGEVAEITGATVFALHVLVPASGPLTQAQLDSCVAQEQAIKERLLGLCRDHLGAVRYEALARTGDPAIAIIRTEEELNADLVVIATHASHRMRRPFPGSVAARVIRESICPVITIRPSASGDPDAVGSHMTPVPLTISPDTNIARVRELMTNSRVRLLPVLKGDEIVGIVTDRDIASSEATLDTTVGLLMTREVITVSPRTSVQEAARLLFECEVDGLPVVDKNKLVGVITRSDILKVFADVEPIAVLPLK
jgi:CBS domain-containing protein